MRHVDKLLLIVRPRIVRYSGHHPADLVELLEASLAERHSLVKRAIDDWMDGVNRFDRPGEALFVATTQAGTVGMCGLNIDPYEDDSSLGRIRHLYVLPEFRRQRIGQRLVDRCLLEAEGVFQRVRVRTFDPVAASFYEAIGFEVVEAEYATHAIDL